MNRRRIFFGAMMLALWAAFGAAPQAFAQDPNRLSALKVAIWPEYDTPTVLVILDGVLADAANLPREISVLIPSDASLLVTTFENPDGSLAPEQPSTSTVLGDGYTRVTFTTRAPKFRVEYYHDLLRGAPDKTMDFVFKASAPTDKVELEIQQPLRATNFSVTPSTQTTRTDPAGFKYFVLQFPALAAGQTISAQVKYTKSDPNPSAPPAAPPATAPPASASSSQWQNIFLVAAMVVLGLTAVIGFLILQKRSREPSHERVSSRSRSQREGARANAAQVAAYCTQCGHELGPQDNFCPRCGTKRRVV
jgi:hypothetical protein